MYLSQLPLYFVNVLLHMVVYFLFSLIPFKKYYRFSNKVTIFLSAVLIAIFCVMDVFFLEKASPLHMWVKVLPIFTIALLFGFGVLIIKGHYLHLLFIVIVCFSFHASLSIIARILSDTYPLASIISWFPEFNNLLIQLGLLALFFLPMWYLSSKLFAKVIDQDIDFLQWKYIVLLPLAVLAMVVMFMRFIAFQTGKGYIEIVFMLVLMLTAYLIYSSVLKILIVNNEKNHAEQERAIAEKQIEFQKSNYARLSENFAETARARHDFKHHYLAIKGFVDSGDIQKAQEYLANYDKEYTVDEEISMCENKAIDALLRHYLSIAKNCGVAVTTDVIVPENFEIDDTELSIIIGNIVENAVEATKRQKSEQKYIDIKATIFGKQLIVIVTNSYDGEIKERGGKIYSSKQKNRVGIGIDSVKKLIDKIGGDIQIEYMDGKFKVYIVLNF